MSAIYTYVRDAIRAVADAAGGALQVTFGTPNGSILMPEDADPNDWLSPVPEPSGQAWDDKNPLKVMLSELGSLLDFFNVSWGYISTNGAGVAPTVDNGWCLGAPTKDEVTNRLTVVVDPAYADQRMFFIAQVYGNAWIGSAVGYAVTYATWEFYDTGGVKQAINDRVVQALFVGKR